VAESSRVGKELESGSLEKLPVRATKKDTTATGAQSLHASLITCHAACKTALYHQIAHCQQVPCAEATK
jgi:hypothetical protein